jgi:hypothetical protein
MLIGLDSAVAVLVAGGDRAAIIDGALGYGTGWPVTGALLMVGVLVFGKNFDVLGVVFGLPALSGNQRAEFSSLTAQYAVSRCAGAHSCA